MDADLIKNATVADVCKGDTLAAMLARDAGDVVFEYLPDYLESAGAPVTRAPHNARGRLVASNTKGW